MRSFLALTTVRILLIVLAAFLFSGVSAPLAFAQAQGEPNPSTSQNAEQPLFSRTTRGIYVRQQTAENPHKIEPLIRNSLAVGITTMVVDLWTPRSKYAEAIRTITGGGIEYVPRITVFPEGGTPKEVRSRAYWEKKYRLVEYALDLGAKEIQLDYIRYNSKRKASTQNAIDIQEVLRFFSERIRQRQAKLQIDVFGEVAHRPSLHIGQDVKLFADEIDVVCPMVYPSHYLPYKERSEKPFETVFDSLTAMNRQLGDSRVDVLAYIELFNHRFPMTVPQRVAYIRAQLKAVTEAGVSGWYAWSAGNHYDLLFEILRRELDSPDKS